MVDGKVKGEEAARKRKGVRKVEKKEKERQLKE